MLRTFLFCWLLIALFACKKSNSGSPHPCVPVNTNCTHQPGDILGKWILEATRVTSYPSNPDPAWEAADCSNATIIEFKSDSSFSATNRPAWLDSAYNRFSLIDQKTFSIYSGNASIYLHPINGQIIDSIEIQLTYMGIDRATEERYDCY
jgi:hypothetical protein